MEKSLYLDEIGVTLYDIAFDWRRNTESDFLEKCMDAYGSGAKGVVLDIACGTGKFLQEMSARGWKVAGVDYSAQMVNLARARLGGETQFVIADMSDFAVTGKFDVATSWLDSLTYLRTNKDIIRHFHCVAKALKDGGIYLLDFSFSRWAEPFWKAPAHDWKPDFSNGWSMSRGDITVYHDGCDGPPCDCFGHLATEYMYFCTTNSGSGEANEYCYTTLKRALHPQEFAAIVSASDVFDLVAWFRDFDFAQTLDVTDGKGRGLVLLMKKSE